jgi:hypothetical protein
MEMILLQDLATGIVSYKSLEDGTVGQFGRLGAPSMYIEAASDIYETDEPLLYLPLTKTFPAIDAVLVDPTKRLVIYALVTVSTAHPIK